MTDTAEYIVEKSRMGETTSIEFREILDDNSPTDEMEVIPGDKDE